MKPIAEMIIATMVIGLIGNGLVMWRDQSIQDVNIDSNSSDIVELRAEDKEQRTKINQIHWYLIESKGVKIPEEIR